MNINFEDPLFQGHDEFKGKENCQPIPGSFYATNHNRHLFAAFILQAEVIRFCL